MGTIHKIVNKLRWTGSLLDRKPELKCPMLTEEKSDEISAGLGNTPWKSSLTCCTGDQGFKLVSMNCHKIPKTETI
jgi:hypothetical protein